MYLVPLVIITCKSAGPAAELGIVLVSTVSGLHNQFTVGKVRIVHTVILDLIIEKYLYMANFSLHYSHL